MGWLDDLVGVQQAAPGNVGSYPEMIARQKIALAMMQQGRRGYPKNIGEGLTSIGDALAERAMLNRMDTAAQNYYRTQQEEEKNRPPPTASDAGDTAAPTTKTADTETEIAPYKVASTEDVAPPQATSIPAAPPLPTVQPGNLATGAGRLGPSPAQAMAANAPIRNAMATSLTAQAVPQPNPMQSDGDQPSDLQATQIPTPVSEPKVLGPAAAVPQIKLAQAQIPGATAQPIPAPLPAPPPAQPPAQAPPIQQQAPGVYDKPVDPGPAPMLGPKSPLQIYSERQLQKAQMMGDPQATARNTTAIAQEEAIRQAKLKQAMDTWTAKKALFDTLMPEYLKSQQGLPLSQAQTSEAQSKAAVAADMAAISAKTGIPADVYITRMDKAKSQAERDTNALINARIAKEAIKNGIVYGMGGDFKLNFERAKAMFGNLPAAELASRSEQYLIAVKSMVTNALENIQPGDPRVTNADMTVANGMQGADLTIQRKTQEKLLNQTMEAIHRRLNNYEDQHSRIKGTKLYDEYKVDAPPIHEDPAVMDQAVKALLANPNLVTQHQFDEEFGAGAAALELGRAKRRLYVSPQR